MNNTPSSTQDVQQKRVRRKILVEAILTAVLILAGYVIMRYIV